MIVNSPRIFGRKGRFFTLKSKVLKRRRKPSRSVAKNSPLVITVVLILIPAVLFGGYYLINTLLIKSRFVTKEIVVEGNRFVSSEMILSAAEIENGVNLFRFDIYEAKKRIEEIPQVLSASIQRELPDKIVIEVVERQARAVIKSKRPKSSMCLDAEGILLPVAASMDVEDITYIEGADLKKAKAGGVCEDDSVLTALDVIRLYDFSWLKGRVSLESIDLNKGRGIILYARERQGRKRTYKVYLGKSEYPQRMANLVEILKKELDLPGRRDRVINLTYDRPVSSPMNGGWGS